MGRVSAGALQGESEMNLEGMAVACICFLLVFWAALTICLFSDREKKRRLKARPPIPRDLPREVTIRVYRPEGHKPRPAPEPDRIVPPRKRLPSWKQFKKRPSLFLIVPYVLLLHGMCAVVILPVLVLGIFGFVNDKEQPHVRHSGPRPR
jgi:hypothetical protein